MCVLWHPASKGKLLEPDPSVADIWSVISKACTSYSHMPAVGQRAVVQKEIVGGFEKFFELGLKVPEEGEDADKGGEEYGKRVSQPGAQRPEKREATGYWQSVDPRNL